MTDTDRLTAITERNKRYEPILYTDGKWLLEQLSLSAARIAQLEELDAAKDGVIQRLIREQNDLQERAERAGVMEMLEQLGPRPNVRAAMRAKKHLERKEQHG